MCHLVLTNYHRDIYKFFILGNKSIGIILVLGKKKSDGCILLTQVGHDACWASMDSHIDERLAGKEQRILSVSQMWNRFDVDLK